MALTRPAKMIWGDPQHSVTTGHLPPRSLTKHPRIKQITAKVFPTAARGRKPDGTPRQSRWGAQIEADVDGYHPTKQRTGYKDVDAAKRSAARMVTEFIDKFGGDR